MSQEPSTSDDRMTRRELLAENLGGIAFILPLAAVMGAYIIAVPQLPPVIYFGGALVAITVSLYVGLRAHAYVTTNLTLLPTHNE